MTTIFMSECMGHWRNPGGTERENAALKRRDAVEAPIAAARMKKRWVALKRQLGLDQAEGVGYVLWAATCALRHRDSVGEYPPTKDDWPLVDGCSGSADPSYNASGWHIAYTRVRDPRASAGVGFRIRAVPDTSLRMPGPLLETDQRGIVVRQDSLNAPGYAVGSPLRPIYALLFDCIRDNSAVRGTGPKGVVTLEDLIFTRQRGCGNMQIFRFESGPPAFDPNVALLNVPTTGFRRFNVATQYQLLYVPHGKKPDAGYDLQLTPLQYGASGIRSYMLTGGTAHVTWEQRRATIADPLADACERDLSQPCSR
jgi:hypothetical protein